MANESRPPTADQVEGLVTPEVVRGLQVIHLALPMGVLTFGGIVAWKAFGSGGAGASDPEVPRLLSLIHPVLAFGTYLAAMVVPRLLKGQPGMPGDPVLNAIRGGAILRLACLEGPALFGWVTCFMAVEAGVLPDQPVYWANAFTTFVLLAYVAARFPTRERIVSAYLEKVGAGPPDLR